MTNIDTDVELPLTNSERALKLIAEAPEGLKTGELQAALGLSYRTALEVTGTLRNSGKVTKHLARWYAVKPKPEPLPEPVRHMVAEAIGHHVSAKRLERMHLDYHRRSTEALESIAVSLLLLTNRMHSA